jgi:transmembrane protein
LSPLECCGSAALVSFSGRALLASLFVFSAISKIVHFANAVSEVQGLRLPAPAVATVLVIVTQGVGAALLLIDRTVWLGAAVLALFTLAATVLGHPFWGESGAAFTRELTTFLEHLGLIGGLALAAVVTQPTPHLGF